MAASDELASLLQSASDLGIAHDPAVRYVSRQTVLRGLRFHFTEWGDPSAPPVLLLHGGNQSLHSWDLVSLHLADRYHVSLSTSEATVTANGVVNSTIPWTPWWRMSSPS